MSTKKTETIRVALAQINPTVGDLKGNTEKIIRWMGRAQKAGADLVSFPELAVTGYPPEDLLFKAHFIDDNLAALKEIARASDDMVSVVGFVDRKKNKIYNAAAVIFGGRVRGIYRKVFLPNYGVFDEMRYFACGETSPVFGLGRAAFGVNICEDIWHVDGPAGVQAFRGARLIVNINASPFHMGKGQMRQAILKKQARRHGTFISYTNLVGGQDELVFDGQSLIVDDKGRVVASGKAFQEDLLVADLNLPASTTRTAIKFAVSQERKTPLSPLKAQVSSTLEKEVYDALVLGLKDYCGKNSFKKIVLGLSGGIDSSLVAAIGCDAIGAENVLGVLMPSVYTSVESREDALALAGNLAVKTFEIPIQDILESYLGKLKDVFARDATPNTTEENLQARIRGNILMALSNKWGVLAVNTGNKSEVSCGYCTLYGDMAGGFGAIKDVPKTLVYRLAAHKNKTTGRNIIPQRVFTKAPTAELRPNQKDQDTLPPYELLDSVLRLYVEEDRGIREIVASGIDEKLAMSVMRMVDFNEYKRRQSAPGIKITPRAFGRDRRMPITNKYR
jgi:NAD+ synthase (glutamine-hydrolysing)